MSEYNILVEKVVKFLLSLEKKLNNIDNKYRVDRNKCYSLPSEIIVNYTRL